MPLHLRIARPVSNLDQATDLYRRGLGLEVVGEFRDHDGFDGVMLGAPDAGYHFEFTRSRRHPIRPAPTPEDLVVLYLPDAAQWTDACVRMVSAGFATVPSSNPYWDVRGRTFADTDGYRTVLQRASWA
ncbi:MAG TPA: VOC family protein [Burkholderiaceae bacterium]|nr:VOC family protein [Burkholderiaceae bacterium]